MDVNDLKGLFGEVNKRMHTAIDHLQHEFAGVRTGRASVRKRSGPRGWDSILPTTARSCASRYRR